MSSSRWVLEHCSLHMQSASATAVTPRSWGWRVIHKAFKTKKRAAFLTVFNHWVSKPFNAKPFNSNHSMVAIEFKWKEQLWIIRMGIFYRPQVTDFKTTIERVSGTSGLMIHQPPSWRLGVNSAYACEKCERIAMKFIEWIMKRQCN